MKIRKLRKRTQEKIRFNRAWNWKFNRFIRNVGAAFKKFDDQVQDVWFEKVWAKP